MRTQKYNRANLEDKRFLFFEIGCILSLTVILIAFNLRSYEFNNINLNYGISAHEYEEMAEITMQEPPPPPPKPMPQSNIIQIVANETLDIEEEIEIDVEADQDTKMEEYVPPLPAEVEEETDYDEVIFVIVESMPEFPGGAAERIKYLSENLQYPEIAREANIQGTVHLSFVVETDGRITEVEILRGIGGGCDEEAVRVVENMPRWIPGKQRNVPVRVRFNFPVKFILR